MKKHAVPAAAVAALAAIAVSAACIATSRGASSEQSVPGLWAKAVALYEANKNLVPGSMVQTVEELDGDGSVKSRTVSELRFSADSEAEGGVRTEIVSAVKDGKDVTGEQRKELAEQQAKSDERRKKKATEEDKEESHSLSSNDSPFDPEFQDKVTVEETDERSTIAGRSCAAFRFSYPRTDENDPKAKPYTVTGTAWLDEETGAPLRVESTRDPLPRGAKHMSSTFLYETPPDGSWLLKEMLFEGGGGFLWIKKNFRMKAVFTDHWLYEERKK